MRRWRPLSIRARLTLWYTGALLAILAVVTGLSYAVLRWNLAQDLDRSLRTVAEVVASAMAAADASGSSAPDVDALLGRELADDLVQVVDPVGEIRFRSARLRSHGLPLSTRARTRAADGWATFETSAAGKRAVRLVSLPIMRGDRLLSVVQVAMPLDAAERTVRLYLATIVVLVPLGVLLAASGGALLARAALRPVDEISRTARRISAERLERRIELQGTGDELDRLAETLNDMLGRLENAFREVRRLSADAAHELRTPLTALKGGLEVALRVHRSPEAYRRTLEASLEEVERLIRLAEDMLLLSRSAAGPETARAKIDLEPLVLEVADMGARLAHGRGVSIRLGAIDAATVVVDASAVRRAMLNLVENAVKYTPPGGVVDLGLATDDGRVSFHVQDTGPGISAEDAERVFEPFVRLDAGRGRDTGGTGLGLAIARSIVVAHGGSLVLDHPPGGGARFTIRLPLA